MKSIIYHSEWECKAVCDGNAHANAHTTNELMHMSSAHQHNNNK